MHVEQLSACVEVIVEIYSFPSAKMMRKQQRATKKIDTMQINQEPVVIWVYSLLTKFIKKYKTIET